MLRLLSYAIRTAIMTQRLSKGHCFSDSDEKECELVFYGSMKENRQGNFVQDSCIPKLGSSLNSTATRLLRRVQNPTERKCNKQRKFSKRHC